MSNNITEVQKALYNKLLTVPGIPASIERENERFKPNIRDPWVRVTLLPNQTTQQSLGVNGYNELSGLYQVSLFFPAGRTDIDTCNALADSVVDTFVPAIFLNEGTTTVTVLDVWRAQSQTESDWFQLPVQVRWNSQQTRN